VKGTDRLGLAVMASLKGAFADLTLPYEVDVVDQSRLANPDLVAHIEKHGIAIFTRKSKDATVWWDMKPLGSLCEKIGSGATPRGGSNVYLDEGIALIRSQNVHNDGFHKDGLAFIGEDEAAALDVVTVESGDVLLNITGDSVARVCQAPASVLPARVNQHVAIIRPKAKVLDAEFLRYLLVAPTTQEQLLALAAAGATRPALTKGMIDRLEVPVPPLPVQRRITRCLGVLGDKTQINRHMNETLDRMARVMFKEWFMDSPVRHRWPTRKWGELISLEYGKSLSGYAGTTRTYPVYGTNGRIGTHSKCLCDHAGVIVGRKGAYRGVHYSDSPFFVIDTAFYVEPREAMELRWVYYELLQLNINRMDSGSAIPSTSRSDLYAMSVVFPPLDLQRRFATSLNPCWRRQKNNERESDALTALRDALLPKLMSGEMAGKG
jgi:type I restriction enzyme S subunit